MFCACWLRPRPAGRGLMVKDGGLLVEAGWPRPPAPGLLPKASWSGLAAVVRMAHVLHVRPQP
eukprot:351841-Chlamydomonas_euryale.AAC.11